jgi:hypothetical protein
MACIFCGKNNINTDEYTKNGKNIIFCLDCKGKYFIDNKGEKRLIKFPKGNINPIISLILLLLLVPIGLYHWKITAQ